MPTDQTEGSSAVEALDRLLAGFIATDQIAVEALMEPEMLGYSRVVAGLQKAGAFHKQLRITLSDTKTLASGDLVRIQTRWEKRFLSYPAMKALRRSGTCTFVMHRVDGVWRLTALEGGNPFAFD